MIDFFLVLISERYAYFRAVGRSPGRPERKGKHDCRLRREVEELASEGKVTVDKISRLQADRLKADLDYEAEIQRGRGWSWSGCEGSQGKGRPC